MWFYFLIFFIIAFFCFVEVRQKNIVIFFLIVLLALAAGLSGPISRDHNLYINAYNNVISGRLITSDISFRLICRFVHSVFNNHIFLFLIYAFIGVTLKIFAIKRLSDFALFSILIYFSQFYFLHEMTQIRAGVASAFVLLSIPSIYERNLKSFLLYSGAAILFHFSALVLLPFYFLKEDKMQIWFFFLIPVGYLLFFLNANIASLVQLVNIDIVNARFAAYRSFPGIDKINIFNVIMLSRCALCAILLWKWKYLREKNQYTVILIKFYIVACFLFIVMADIPVIAFRVSELLAVVEIVLIPMIIYLFNIKVLGKVGVAFIGFIYLCFVLFHEKLVMGYF